MTLTSCLAQPGLGQACNFQANGVLCAQQWDSEGEAMSSGGQMAGLDCYPMVLSPVDSGLVSVSPTDLRWYAVRTRSRHEKIATQQLHTRGIETFLPVVTQIHRWSDRKKQVEVP